MNIAILSPNENAFSETFIQAHKNLIDGKVFYYFGNKPNLQIEGQGPIQRNPISIYYKLQRKLYGRPYSWYYDRLVQKSFKDNRIELILAEYGPTANDYLNVARSMKLPLVVHFHGYDASVKGVLKKYSNYKEVFRYASYVVVVSRQMQRQIIKIGCREHKVVYNPCGPHPDFSKIEPTFKKPQFIAVGRFVDKKAPYYTILAFNRILEKFPEAILIMAGKGTLLNTCINLVRHLGIEENVKFPGIISREQYLDYLSESVGFVQHSVTAENGDSEGTPVALLEASSAGLPVISTFHAGIPDVIVDQETGFLVDEHDIEGMAANMEKLLVNPEIARKVGQKGKSHIQKNFTLDQHITILNKVIEKAAIQKSLTKKA